MSFSTVWSRPAELSRDVIVDNKGWTAATHARKDEHAASGEDFWRLMAALGPVRAGDRLLTPQSTFDWFTGAYPIRDLGDSGCSPTPSGPRWRLRERPSGAAGEEDVRKQIFSRLSDDILDREGTGTGDAGAALG